MREINPHEAVDYILLNGKNYAKSRAERIYLEEYRKTLKAILFQKSDGNTISDREAYAYSHPDYLLNLNGIREAVELEEKLRWDLIAAQARIEIYRTDQATARTEGRAVR